jgi:hypothetical protein
MGIKKAAIRGRIAAGVQTTNKGVVWKCEKYSNAPKSLEVINLYMYILFRYIAILPK